MDVNISRTLLFLLCGGVGAWLAYQDSYAAFVCPVIYWLGHRYYTG